MGLNGMILTANILDFILGAVSSLLLGAVFLALVFVIPVVLMHDWNHGK